MKIQKTYIIYTIIMWILWSSIIIFVRASGNAFDAQNEQLFFMIKKVATIVYWISLIPVIPVLWCFAFAHTIKNEHYPYLVFNILSIIVSALLSFQFLVIYLVGILGGV